MKQKFAGRFLGLILATSVACNASQASPVVPLNKLVLAKPPSLNSSLFRAIRARDLAAVRSLLKRGAAVNARDQESWTPLMVAARSNGIPLFNGGEDEPIVSLPIVEALLARGADVNARMDYGGTTVLQLAVYSGSMPLVRLLLKHGANPNGNAEGASTPLRDAMAQGNLPIVQILLKAGAKVEANSINGSLLATAVETNSLDFAKFLVAHNVSVNQSDSQGITPLMHAAGDGQLEMARFLLAKGARVNAKTFDGETALSCAVTGGSLEIARALIKAGAHVNTRELQGYTPLMHAAEFGNDAGKGPLVELLLDHGANPNLHGKEDTPLILAAKAGNVKAVELMLDKGANVHASTNWCGSALLAVVESGNVRWTQRGLYAAGGVAPEKKDKEAVDKLEAQAASADIEIVTALLKHGANVTMGYNRAALIDAAGSGSDRMVRFLISQGAAVNIRDSDAPSPAMEIAARERQGDSYEAVQARENERLVHLGPNGTTPLMAAARKGHSEVVKTLLDAGALPDVRDNFGKTALHYVGGAGRGKIAREMPVTREAMLTPPVPGLSPRVTPTEAARMRKWADDGDTAIIAALLAKRASLEVRDADGRTALMEAAVKSSPIVFGTLLKAGGAVDARDSSGRTALMLLAGDCRLAHARDLFLDPPDTTVTRARGQSLASLRAAQKAATAKGLAETERQQAAVIRAQTAEDVAVLRALLAAGADPTLIDLKGRTALTIAEAAHHDAIAAVLRKTPAPPGTGRIAG